MPLRDCFCWAGSIFSTGASAAEVATDAAAFLPFLRDWGFAAAAFSPAAGLALLCAAFRLPESFAVACFLPLRDGLGLAGCLAWFAFASAVFAWFVLASLKPASLVFASLAPSVLASLKLALLVFRLPLALRDFLPALPSIGAAAVSAAFLPRAFFRLPLSFAACFFALRDERDSPPDTSTKSILLVSKSARATLMTTRSPILNCTPLRSPIIDSVSGW